MPSLELLVSPPGTGKTARCIELFKQRILNTRAGIGSRSYFVLPSREHADRIQNLILRRDVPGLFNAHILTIQDLADRFLEGGGRPADSVRRAAAAGALDARDASGESVYGYFRDSLELGGFRELALEVVREFKAGLLSTADFERRAQPLLKDPVFRSKFRDFSILLKRYDAALEALGVVEADDEIARLEMLDGRPGRPDLVIFDGFYHFTRAQAKLLVLLSRWADHTVVTLTLDPAHSAGEALFGYPERTRRFLRAAGFRESAPSDENHRAAHPALKHLAAHLFAASPPKFEGESPAAVFSAPSRRAEYEMIAREIRKLYREGPYHFSDVCLILRGVSGQRALIESTFAEFAVPVAIHERNRLVESGLAGALHRLLRLAVDDWRRDDVLYLAKSSYFRDRLALADALEIERAALREGLREGRAAWETLAANAALSAPARAFLSFLLETEARLLSAPRVHAFAAVVRAYLEPLAAASGDAIDAAAARAIASMLAAARRRYGSDAPFDASRYARELLGDVEDGLFSTKARGRNRVQVYDVVMALPKEYKVVFVCDLLEKTFPQPVTEDPLFKDAERSVLNGDDPALEERRFRLTGERYFFYMAVTRARERLYLTHSTHDADGKPSLRSFFVDEALACFGEHAVERRSRDLSRFLPRPDEWESETDVARGVAALRGAPAGDAFAREVLAAWDPPEMLARGLSRTALQAGFRDPRVLKAVASLERPFSASTLEAFLTCPFRHYAEHLLGLNRSIEGHEEAEMGTLLHEVLYEYFVAVPEADRISGAYFKDAAKMEADLEAIFDRKFEEGPFRGQPAYRRAAWRESMRAMLKRYVRLEGELAGSGVPSHFEWEFGKNKKEGLRIPAAEGDILLKGTVDRVDVDPATGRAVVIDYKKSSRNLREKLKKGHEIQLPIYLLAVRSLLGLEPAGFEHRVLKTGRREDAGLSDEDMENLLAETEDRVRQAVRRIRAGEITVESRDCKFCEFDAVCRVEAKKIRGR